MVRRGGVWVRMGGVRRGEVRMGGGTKKDGKKC